MVQRDSRGVEHLGTGAGQDVAKLRQADVDPAVIQLIDPRGLEDEPGIDLAGGGAQVGCVRMRRVAR